MSAELIFLEITDQEISNLLNSLREIFNEKEFNTNIHLTVRGPYPPNSVEKKDLDKWYSVISNDDLLLSGIDRFDANSRYIVYIKVKSENLKKIWNKPDYPVQKFGFNPHITLYDGDSKRRADCIYAFLKKQKLDLLCSSFRLTTYVSKQLPLFEEEPIANGKWFFELANRRKVRADILQKAINTLSVCN